MAGPTRKELLAKLAERDEIIARKDERIAALEREIGLLNQKVDALVRRIFGSSSEPFNPNQLDLFGATAPDAPEESGKVCASCSGEAPRQKTKRREPRFPEDAPVEEIVLDPLEVQAEPEAYQCIGQEVSVQHDFTPGTFRKILTVRRKYVRKSEVDAKPVIAALKNRPVKVGEECRRLRVRLQEVEYLLGG